MKVGDKVKYNKGVMTPEYLVEEPITYGSGMHILINMDREFEIIKITNSWSESYTIMLNDNTNNLYKESELVLV